MPATLSVVVAVHDVAPWVQECLSSVAACVPPGTQVVVVDDGSTDGSGEVVERAVARHPGWKAVHQENRGLGAARNVGLDASDGEYVGFVDGDDVLLPGYSRLVEGARRDGLAMATGAVSRTDGQRSWPSALHRRAHAGLGERADIRRNHGLIFDTTAWNKVYRRSLLAEHGLRFPEGMLYEDLPVTIPAFCQAGEVGVVHEPVYAWRSRTQGLSITQRRYETQNLRDRFAAVRAVDAYLDEHELHDLRLAHDDKVLRLDLPLYTAALPEADEEYRAAYLTFFRHLANALGERQRAALPPTLRLYVELADAGRMEDLLRAVRGRRGPRPWASDERGALTRVRDDWAVYGLERELGLASGAQIARRVPARTLRLLLPTHARRQFGTAAQRLREARRRG